MTAAPSMSPWPLLTAFAVLLLSLGIVVFAQGLFVAPGSVLSPVLGAGAPWLGLAGLVALAAGIAGWMGEGRGRQASAARAGLALPETTAAAATLARRNAAVLWSLVGFIVLVFVITVVRLDPGEIERPPLTLHPQTPPPASPGGAP